MLDKIINSEDIDLNLIAGKPAYNNVSNSNLHHQRLPREVMPNHLHFSETSWRAIVRWLSPCAMPKERH